eukprot:357590-Chlamydomonas_euryale.AAC.2
MRTREEFGHRRDDVGHYALLVLHKAGYRGTNDEHEQATYGPFWLIYYKYHLAQSYQNGPPCSLLALLAGGVQWII